MGKVDGCAGSALGNFLPPLCFSVTMGSSETVLALLQKGANSWAGEMFSKVESFSQCPTPR